MCGHLPMCISVTTLLNYSPRSASISHFFRRPRRLFWNWSLSPSPCKGCHGIQFYNNTIEIMPVSNDASLGHHQFTQFSCIQIFLTHCGPVLPYGSWLTLGQVCLVACSAPSHCLDQWWQQCQNHPYLVRKFIAPHKSCLIEGGRCWHPS